jgi:5-amino-6-(5-phosphoribosylamino)uracil reductase
VVGHGVIVRRGIIGAVTDPRSPRPHVLLSAAMSLDGRLDDASPSRLVLSDAADLDRVDGVRAQNDAIMVGASTIRNDDPRLLVRSPGRRALRQSAGMPWSPAKVTVTSSGDLDPTAAFFTTGEGPRVVYTPRGRARRLGARLGDLATVVGLGERVAMADVLDDLGGRRGIRRLMVEGGGTVLTQFLADDLVDELQLVVAPFFVGEARAPRAIGPGRFPWTASRRATLASTEQIGDVVLLRYALSDRFGEGEQLLAEPIRRAALPADAR